MTTPSLHELGVRVGEGRTAEIYAWSATQVVKLYRPDWPLVAIEHESQITTKVAQTGLPVPAVGGVITANGRTGILFERIDGPTLVQHFAAQPWTILSSVRAFTDLHLAMHAQQFTGFPSQREQLRRKIGEADVPTSARQAALFQLDQLPEGTALCHGDYHPENVLITRRGPIIIDWTEATRGHPLADVARTALLLQMGALPGPRMSQWLLASARAIVYRAYLRRYLRRGAVQPTDLARWQLPIVMARLGEGIPEERGNLLRRVETLIR
jgi:aminoglycoside phosphotransferase (APT) family kinase protein